MRIIIFGGCFDPIHLGHIEIAKSAINQIGADFLYFVPAKEVKYKKIHASDVARYEMIKIATHNHPKLLISNYELSDNSEYSYTYKTVQYFKNNFNQPNDEFFLLIGNDQLEQFDKWKNYQDILKNAKLLVYPRNNRWDDFLIHKYGAIKINGRDVSYNSSTRFRQELDFSLIDKDVINYILNNGIYSDLILKTYLSNDRYLHSMRVAQMMKNLFVKYDNSLVRQAFITGLYHDIAKEMDKNQLEFIAYNILKLKKTHYKILHGPVGSYLLSSQLGINDKLVLNAIARHTKPFDYGTGDLSILDMAIYCCDKLESLRTEQDINNIKYFRDLLQKDIKKCFYELYEATQQQYK